MKRALIFITILFVLSLHSIAQAENPHYAIIIDAGSTGSRLHLFQYINHNPLPIINEEYTSRSESSLASFARHDDQAGFSFQPLLNEVLNRLTVKHIDPKEVSISVLGTGGMRLLPIDEQNKIYANVKKYLKASYPFQVKTCETIPGKLEGLYAWLDVNYLLGNFDRPIDTTVGSLEIGGASMQITFATEVPGFAADKINITVAKKSYIIFSKSVLGMGQDKLLEKMNAEPLASFCYPSHYPLSKNNSGNFNFYQCENLYTKIIHQYNLPQTILPITDKQFVANASIYNTYQFMSLAGNVKKEQLAAKVNEICCQSWEQLQAQYPNEPASLLVKRCATAVYLYDLIYNVWQLSPNHLIVTNKINDQEINWPLGVIFYTLIS